MTSEFVARSSVTSNRSSPMRFILSHVRRHPIVAVGLVIGAFSNAALAAVIPYYAGIAFNAIIERNDLQTVAWAAVAIVVSQIIRAVLQLMRNFSSETYAQRIERDVRDELYASLLGKSMAYHDLQPVGEIMARVTNDVREMNLMMSPGANMLVGAGMFLVTPVLASASIHPALAIVPGAFVIAYVYSLYRYVVKIYPIAQAVRRSFGRMNAELAETLDGLQVVKGAAQEEQEIHHFNDLADEVRDRFIQQGEIEARYIPLLLLGLAYVAAFLHSLYLYQAGVINAGGIVNFMGQVSLFGFPVFVSLTAFSHLALGYASAGRILQVINTQTELDQNEAGHSAPIQGAIAFENVDFGYSEDKQALHDVHFSVHPGKTVAIVGQTGAGKTTITKLINRIYDVHSGRVLVDGVDVREWNLAALRSQISIIEQDIFLFSRTVRENISFGKPDATQEEVEEAARKAQAHEFIMGFPDGYDTVIGRRGVTLSGGQRQRLALARAFLTNPPILILDDSTSAIDSATEDHIQRAIWAASQGRTTILITHRLSQIRWADHIVVLRKGRVAAQGTHEALLASSEAYRRIFARYESREEAEQPTPSEAGLSPEEAR